MKVLLVAVGLLSVAPCSADSSGPTPSQAVVEGADLELAAKGKELYDNHCSQCHGFNMVNPGNYSYDLRQFPHGAKDRFVNSVLNGKNGRMPPWRGALEPKEIDAIWAYVLTEGRL